MSTIGVTPMYTDELLEILEAFNEWLKQTAIEHNIDKDMLQELIKQML